MLRSLTCIALVSISLAACTGEDERPRTPSTTPVASAETARWAFVDAFAALKSANPEERLHGVEWIGAHLATHASLAKEALRAAAADEDATVAHRAKVLLRRLDRR